MYCSQLKNVTYYTVLKFDFIENFDLAENLLNYHLNESSSKAEFEETWSNAKENSKTDDFSSLFLEIIPKNQRKGNKISLQ